MQFRAVLPTVSLAPEEWLYLRDVQCPVCYALFRLWAPIIWTEQTDVAIHTDWLTQHLMNTCPNHDQDIRTPHPSTEKYQTYWLEEARAHAIKEAEDAGLRGPEREKFIQERTDIYYAELLLKRVG
jgi:predicted DsbA family dithiol-disulfide isomerase